MKIPAQLAQSVRARWPDRADDWLIHLEPELTELCQRFSATPQRILPARYALVIAATTPDGDLIMRATTDPDATAQTTVAKALAQLDVGPAIHATSATDTGTWTVMDQVKPGTPLADIDPNTLDFAKLTAPIRTMASAPPPGDELPSILDWLRDRLADDHLNDLPPGETTAPHAERRYALQLLDELTADFHPGLCHGDASPWNLLTRLDGEWKLIDPRGIYGEAEYDAAVLALKIGSSIDNAVTRVAEMVQLNHTRIQAWERIARAARV